MSSFMHWCQYLPVLPHILVAYFFIFIRVNTKYSTRSMSAYEMEVDGIGWIWRSAVPQRKQFGNWRRQTTDYALRMRIIFSPSRHTLATGSTYTYTTVVCWFWPNHDMFTCLGYSQNIRASLPNDAWCLWRASSSATAVGFQFSPMCSVSSDCWTKDTHTQHQRNVILRYSTLRDLSSRVFALAYVIRSTEKPHSTATT